jgi:peptidoglycan/xylan/chitin deacetylase (PgdA/CDA1 family)
VKRWVKLVIAGSLYYSGLERLLRKLVPRKGAAIFMYHSVQPVNALTQVADFCAEPAEFEEQIRFLKRYPCVRMSDVSDAIAGRSFLPDDAIAITFDDGYADNFTYVYRTLRQLRVPATIYLASDYVGTARWLPLNRLYDAIMRTGERALSIPVILQGEFTGQTEVRLETESDRRAAISRFRAQIKRLSPDRVEKVVNEICDSLQRSKEKFRGHEFDMLSWPQVTSMLDLVEFGSHTSSHCILSRAEDSQVDAEISDSRRVIEERTGRRVIHFAYPNGRMDDYDARAIAALGRYGFQTAVTTVNGINQALASPFELRRVTFAGPKCMVAFELLGLTTSVKEFIRKLGQGQASRGVKGGQIS